MFEVLAFASISLSSVFRWDSSVYGARSYLFLILASAWVATLVGRRIHWSVGLALFWTLFSGASVFGSPWSAYAGSDQPVLMVFAAVSSDAYISVLLVAILLAHAGESMLERITRAFAAVCVADSLLVILQWAAGAHFPLGFLDNASMNACFIACTYPFIQRKYSRPRTSLGAALSMAELVVPVAAIILSRSNMAMLSFLAAWSAPCLARLRRMRHKDYREWFFTAGIFSLGSLAVMGTKFGQSNGRTELWRSIMAWWWGHSNPLTGAGLGTFSILGPSVQASFNHQTEGFFIWMHSDWLQILFEEGAVGLALVAIMVACAFRASIRSRRFWLTSSIAAYAVTMIGNFPNHLPSTGFLGAFLVTLAFI